MSVGRRLMRGVLCAWGCIFCCISSGVGALPAGLSNKIDQSIAALHREQPGLHIGLVVQSLSTGMVLYARNASNLFLPASVQKLVTATQGLVTLTPQFRFKTRLLRRGIQQGDTINGDVILQFDGDPELTHQAIQSLFAVLRRQGVRHIRGAIIVDRSVYGLVPYPPGWIWDDLSYRFAAPLRAMIMDKNQWTMTIRRPKKHHRLPLVKTSLPGGLIQLSNDLKMTPHRNKQCPIRIYSDVDNRYRLMGCYWRGWVQQRRIVAIRNLTAYVRQVIERTCAGMGVTYQHLYFTRRAIHTDHAQLLATHVSRPLGAVVHDMLKHSDNLDANAIFKKLGERQFGRPGTWQKGVRAVMPLLQQLSVPGAGARIEDGAGLSHYAALSPQQLSAVLFFIYRHPDLYRAMLADLPVAGVDGTLAHRMTALAPTRAIHLKTGSMTGVSSLAGYLHTPQYGDLGLVVMVNGVLKPRKSVVDWEDHLNQLLMQQGG